MDNESISPKAAAAHRSSLFSRFGGVRRMAELLGEPPSTVQSWKLVGRIPAAKQPAVLRKARELGLPVTAEDVIFPLGREQPTNEIDNSRVVICDVCERPIGGDIPAACTFIDCPHARRSMNMGMAA